MNVKINVPNKRSYTVNKDIVRKPTRLGDKNDAITNAAKEAIKIARQTAFMEIAKSEAIESMKEMINEIVYSYNLRTNGWKNEDGSWGTYKRRHSLLNNVTVSSSRIHEYSGKNYIFSFSITVSTGGVPAPSPIGASAGTGLPQLLASSGISHSLWRGGYVRDITNASAEAMVRESFYKRMSNFSFDSIKASYRPRR